LSACLTLTRCRLRVTPFLPGGRRGIPLFIILYVPGETLGPVWSGQQCRVDGVSLREVVSWFGVLRNAWNMVENDGGCNGCGSSLFRYFAIASIYFLFGHVFVVAPTLSWFWTIVSVWLLY
jgi:hypothetical protein